MKVVRIQDRQLADFWFKLSLSWEDIASEERWPAAEKIATRISHLQFHTPALSRAQGMLKVLLTSSLDSGPYLLPTDFRPCAVRQVEKTVG